MREQTAELYIILIFNERNYLINVFNRILQFSEYTYIKRDVV